MSKHWREPLDPKRHVDHHFAGGPRPREAETGEAYAYFVEVCRFTFELASLEQIEACAVVRARRRARRDGKASPGPTPSLEFT